ncbi:MAG TPA: hypothetical protein VK708_10630 [Bryobacteraceae bacterium]|jgi:hypothetical protein|nr:hypothetical protein [Bryobacteraceae bacterium]
MAVPPIPPPLAQLGRRPFSFYPAILNAGHNEWVYRSATWSDVLVRNTKTNEEVSVPRRYVGEISRVDAPVMIVGLLAELEYRVGVVWPVERRVIEMPRAVNDAPRPRLAQSQATRAPVVGIRLESERTSRVGKVVVGGVALGVAGCVLAISLFRGGVIGTRVFYAPFTQAELPFTPDDDHSTVVRALGQPAADRWSSDAAGTAADQYELLAYPQRKLYVILMRANPGGAPYTGAHYIGAMDWNWHPVHSVDMAGHGSSYGLLRRLPRF